MTDPLVSIIIVNWNGKEVFSDCLKSLQKIYYPNWELIVVDNGSYDGSNNLVKDFTLTLKRYYLIQNKKNEGFANANNQGFKKSNGKYILLLNNDTKISPSFLNTMIERMEQDKLIGAMQPKILLMDQPGLLDNAGSFLTGSGFLQHWGFMQKDGSEFDKETEVFSAKGACLLIRTEVIEKIGLFDDQFISYFEESDFCYRVWLAGYKVIYFPKTYIYHKLGATSKKMDQIFVNYNAFKNRILSLFKNLSLLNLIRILIPHLFIVAFLGFYYLIKLEFSKSGMIFSAIIWNITNLSQALKKRTETQRMRIKSDSEIFQKIYKPIDIRDMFLHFKKVEANFK